MKGILKRIAGAVMTAAILCSTVGSAYAATQNQSSNIGNSTYTQSTNTWKQDGTDRFFYVDQTGSKLSGWHNGYYLNETAGDDYGLMKFGWFTDKAGNTYFLNTNHDGNFGHVVSGWQWIDGYCYYFNADGVMAKNTSIDGYSVDFTGRWIVNGMPKRDTSKGMISKHTHEIIPTSSNDRRSTSANSKKEDNKNSESNTEKKDDTAEENKITVNDNVFAVGNPDSTEGKELLRETAESIVDYGSFITGNENSDDNEYTLIVKEGSVLYDFVNGSECSAGSVMLFPQCEYFPMAVALTYLSHDDKYGNAKGYNSNDYEVIHTRISTFTELFADGTSFYYDKIDEDNPIAFVTTNFDNSSDSSTISAINDETGIDDDTNTRNVLETTNAAGLKAFSRSNETTKEARLLNSLPTQIDLLSNSNISFEEDLEKIIEIKSKLEADVNKDFSSSVDVKFEDNKLTATGGIELFDSFDLNLEWVVSDIEPKYGVDIKNGINQIMGVVEFDLETTFKEVGKLELSIPDKDKDEDDDNDNDKKIFGVSGVDVSNEYALVGVNLLTGNTHVTNEELKSISEGLSFSNIPEGAIVPEVLFWLSTDFNGEFNIQEEFEAHQSDHYRIGSNIQKLNYEGEHGSCEDNKSQQIHIEKLGYQVDLYNERTQESNDHSLMVSGKVDAHLYMTCNLGFVVAGIMPVRFQLGAGPEFEANVVAKATWENNQRKETFVYGNLKFNCVAFGKAQGRIALETNLGIINYAKEINIDFELFRLILFNFERSHGEKITAGTIYNNSKEPIENAQITIVNSNGETISTLKTDEKGRYWAALATGVYKVKVSANGYVGKSATLEVKADDVLTNLDVTLNDLGMNYVGFVTDEEGNPLKDVQVNFTYGSDNVTVITDEKGFYHAQVKQSLKAYKYTFEKENYFAVSGTAQMILRDNSTVKQNITMVKKTADDYAALEITVKDDDNKLVKGVKVKIVGDDYNKTCVTNANGQFTVSKLNPGEYTLSINDDAYIQFEDTVILKAGELTHKTLSISKDSYQFIIKFSVSYWTHTWPWVTFINTDKMRYWYVNDPSGTAYIWSYQNGTLTDFNFSDYGYDYVIRLALYGDAADTKMQYSVQPYVHKQFWIKVLTPISKNFKGSDLREYFKGAVNLESVPDNIFSTISGDPDLTETFYGCSKLEKVPELWLQFPDAPHDGCFTGCTNASNYDDIPDDWK